MLKVSCFALLGLVLATGLMLPASQPSQPQDDALAIRYYLRNRTNNFYQRSRGHKPVRHHRLAMDPDVREVVG